MNEQDERVIDTCGSPPPRIGEVLELPLLLPAGDASALERAAHRRGLTVGQMLRALVRDFLREPDGGPCPR
jgi:hypothetical protein